MSEMQIESAGEASWLRDAIARGEVQDPAAQGALDTWDAGQSTPPPPEAEVVDQEDPESQLTPGSPADAFSKMYYNLRMDSEARLEAVDAAMNTPVPMVIQERDEQGNPRERPTTIEERTDFRQQAIWDNLNPVQQGIISLGRGGEKAWDLIGFGDVSEAQELVMDAVETGALNEGIELLGQASQFEMVATGLGAGVKIALAGLKAGVRGSGDAAVKYMYQRWSQLGQELSPEAVNSAMEVVAKSPKGKKSIQAVANSKNPDVAVKATEDLMDKVQTIAGPLKKSQDIRHADPRLTQQTALSRTQKQRIGQGRINEEMTKNAAQRQAEAVQRAARLEDEIKAATETIKTKSQARVAAAAKEAARKRAVEQEVRRAQVVTKTSKAPPKAPKSDPRNAQSAAIRASRARKAAKRRQELKEAMKQSPGSR